MLIVSHFGKLALKPVELPCAQACLQQPAGGCQDLCRRLASGIPFPAVGQRSLNSGMGKHWSLPASTLVRVGAPSCGHFAQDDAGVCEGCSTELPTGGTWNFSEVVGKVVVVKLHHCDVQRKARLLGDHGAIAVVTIARKASWDLLGFYSKVANHYIGSVSANDGAPVVMVDNRVGEILWQLLDSSDMNSLSLASLSADHNKWDDIYNPMLWVPLGLCFLLGWSILLLIAMRHVRQHIGSHGLKQNKTMRTIISLLVICSLSTVRFAYLPFRSPLGDLVHPLVEATLDALILPVIYTLPLSVLASWSQGKPQLPSNFSYIETAQSFLTVSYSNRSFVLCFSALALVTVLRSTLIAFNHYDSRVTYAAFCVEMCTALLLLFNLCLTVRIMYAALDLYWKVHERATIQEAADYSHAFEEPSNMSSLNTEEESDAFNPNRRVSFGLAPTTPPTSPPASPSSRRHTFRRCPSPPPSPAAPLNQLQLPPDLSNNAAVPVERATSTREMLGGRHVSCTSSSEHMGRQCASCSSSPSRMSRSSSVESTRELGELQYSDQPIQESRRTMLGLEELLHQHIRRGVLYLLICYTFAGFELATRITLSTNPRVHFGPTTDVAIEVAGYALRFVCTAALLLKSTQRPLTLASMSALHTHHVLRSPSNVILNKWLASRWKPKGKAWKPILNTPLRGGGWVVSILQRNSGWQRGELLVEPCTSAEQESPGSESSSVPKLHVQIGGRELVFGLNTARLTRLGVHQSNDLRNLDRTLKLTGIPWKSPGESLVPMPQLTKSNSKVSSRLSWLVPASSRNLDEDIAASRSRKLRSKRSCCSMVLTRPQMHVQKKALAASHETLLLRFADVESMYQALSYSLRAADMAKVPMQNLSQKYSRGRASTQGGIAAFARKALGKSGREGESFSQSRGTRNTRERQSSAWPWGRAARNSCAARGETDLRRDGGMSVVQVSSASHEVRFASSSVPDSVSSSPKPTRPNSSRVSFDAAAGDEYSRHNPESRIRLTVGVCTWNMGNARPYANTLPALLPTERSWGKLDILALGVQEADFKASFPHPSAAADWFKSVQSHLGGDYEILAARSLWEIRLLVAVRAKLAPYVSNVCVALAFTGRFAGAGGLGNKGAVTVCLDFMGSRLAFTTAHFAAHQRKVKNRNDTFQEICADTTIPSLLSPDFGDFTLQSDVCFWCGDLNYRLDLPRQHVIDTVTAAQLQRPRACSLRRERSCTMERDHLHVTEGEMHPIPSRRRSEAVAAGATDLTSPYASLWKSDQLRQEMAAGRVFTGWSEVADPDFPPSYKYSRQPEPAPHAPASPRVYGDEEGKQRVPSYTDRVLYRCNSKSIEIVCLEYTSVDTIVSSDHSPVRSIMNVYLPLPYLDIAHELTPFRPSLADFVRSRSSMNILAAAFPLGSSTGNLFSRRHGHSDCFSPRESSGVMSRHHSHSRMGLSATDVATSSSSRHTGDPRPTMIGRISSAHEATREKLNRDRLVRSNTVQDGLNGGRTTRKTEKLTPRKSIALWSHRLSIFAARINSAQQICLSSLVVYISPVAATTHARRKEHRFVVEEREMQRREMLARSNSSLRPCSCETNAAQPELCQGVRSSNFSNSTSPTGLSMRRSDSTDPDSFKENSSSFRQTSGTSFRQNQSWRRSNSRLSHDLKSVVAVAVSEESDDDDDDAAIIAEEIIAPASLDDFQTAHNGIRLELQAASSEHAGEEHCVPTDQHAESVVPVSAQTRRMETSRQAPRCAVRVEGESEDESDARTPSRRSRSLSSGFDAGTAEDVGSESITRAGSIGSRSGRKPMRKASAIMASTDFHACARKITNLNVLRSSFALRMKEWTTEAAHAQIANVQSRSPTRQRAALQAGDKLRAGMFGLHFINATCGRRSDRRPGAAGVVTGSLAESSAESRQSLPSEFASRLTELESSWQAPLLRAAFDQPIAFNSHIVNFNVLREQHLAVVIMGRHSITIAARIDLYNLINPAEIISGQTLTVPLQEPIFRNGLLVGYLSGNLTIQPAQTTNSATSL